MSVSMRAPMMWPMEARKKVAPASTRHKNRYRPPIFNTTCRVSAAKLLMPMSVTYRTSRGSVSSHKVVSAAQNRSNTSTQTYFLKYGRNRTTRPFRRFFWLSSIFPLLF